MYAQIGARQRVEEDGSYFLKFLLGREAVAALASRGQAAPSKSG
jgi:hypothetical protein